VTATASPPAGEPHVEPAVAPPPGNPRFPLIDSLRALAAISVVVYHTAYASLASFVAWYRPVVGHLDVGVPLFFAISGFLLYRPFAAAHFKGGARPRTRDYLRRRVLRIVPAYWLALTVLAIYPGLVGVFGTGSWRYYGFLQIYDSDTVLAGLPQSWSLAVEATFYLALPVYAIAIRRICRGRGADSVLRVEIATLALLALASLAWRTWRIHEGSLIAQTTLPGLFTWFAPGMALAVLSVAMQEGGRRWRAAAVVARRPWLPWLAAAAVFAVLAATVEPVLVGGPGASGLDYLTINVCSAVVAILVLVPAVVGTEGGGAVRGLLSLRVLAWLGLISYGIFLWHHTPMLWLVNQGALTWIPGSEFVVLTVVTLAFAVSAATLSYYLVERPILRFKDPRRARRAG
jgi:peptidoglycan/LPS O-acetylase OafA/YrhL